jgi:hypothetical protein
MGPTNTKCSGGPIRPGRSTHSDGLRAGWGPLGSFGAVSPFSPSGRHAICRMTTMARAPKPLNARLQSLDWEAART